MALHRAGNLLEARKRCQALLLGSPDNPELLLLAGQVELQSGKVDSAIAFIERALVTQPHFAAAEYSRGVALQSIGRLGEALQSYARATVLEPERSAAHYNSGIVLQALGRNEGAVQSYEAALRAQPHYLDALHNLGLALSALGRFEQSAAAFDKILQRAPNDVSAQFNLGLALYNANKLDASLGAFNQALAQQPKNADARCARAMVLEALGRDAEALRDYQQAFAGGFRDAQAFNRHGNLLLKDGRPVEAIRSFDAAISLAAGDADIFNGRGVALLRTKQFGAALDDFRAAIALDDSYIVAHYNAAACAMSLGLVDETLGAIDRTLRSAPKNRDEAAARDGAMAMNIFFRRQMCLWPGIGELQQQAAMRVRSEDVALDPFQALIFFDDPSLHRVCAGRAATAIVDKPVAARFSGKRGQRLKIGYLSADFHDHATTRLMAELFELHDKSRFEIVAYSYGHDDGSAMRARVMRAFDAFHDVRQLTDAQIADRIARERVQILVDLKGHTRDARMGIAARRPAPIQAHYIGFPGTLGGNLVDYILADAVVAPFGDAANYSEAIVHLPDCYQVNDRSREISARTPSRAECGLPNGAFVLCGFAQPFKLSPEVFDVWLRILSAVPRSVLWLLSYNEETQGNLRREASDRGVAPERLIFAPTLDLAEHLARQRLADLYLDTWPYGAHTSASDALWVGLPVVTCPGRSFASRVAASLLSNMGVPELVAADFDAYVAIALRLANDAELRAATKQKLEANKATRALFDTDRFRRGIERAYEQMWDIFERGERPRHFAVARE